MAGISFDDLIPQKATKGQAQGLSFDDLIPQAPQAQPETETYFDPIQGEVTITKAQSQAATANTGGPGVIEALTRGGGQGITFGAGDELYAGLEEARGKATRSRGQEGSLPSYDQALDEARAGNKAAEEAHPWAYNIGKVVGNAAAILPAAATAIGSRVLGATGALVPRMVAGTASGAVLGGAQSFAEGEGNAHERARDIGWGAGIGALGGVVAPVVGAGAGAAARWVGDKVGSHLGAIPGMGRTASQMFTDDVETAGLNQVQGRLQELGREAMLLDTNPTFQGRAMGLATLPETRATIAAPLEARNQAANARLAKDLEENIGPAPVPSQVEAQFQAKRDALQPRYTEELNKARPLTFEEANGLRQVAEDLAGQQKGEGQRLLSNALDLIAPLEDRAGQVPGQRGGYLSRAEPRRIADTSPQGLMATRKAIDGMMARVEESAQLQREGVSMRLQQLRNAIDERIYAINPEIKNLDRAYETFSDATNGFREGQRIFERDVHPADVAAAMRTAPIEQQAGHRLGARAAIDQEVSNTANDLNAFQKIAKKPEDWNYQKLAEMFGPDEANMILAARDREAAFAEAYQNILKGPQSAQRLKAAQGVEIRGLNASPADVGTVIAGAVGGPHAAVAATGVKAVNAGGRALQRASDIARNEQLARVLTLPQGRDMDMVLEATGRRIRFRETGRRAAPYVDRLVQALITGEGLQAGQQVQGAIDPQILARALMGR